MNATRFLTLGILLLAGGATAQHHDPVYVAGGFYHDPGKKFAEPGIFLLDMTGAPNLKKLCLPGDHSHGFCMDHDNKNIVLTVRWSPGSTTIYVQPRGGLFRYDPAANTLNTVYARSTTLHYFDFFNVVVDQNGDYLVNGYEHDALNVANRRYGLWKIWRDGRLSTMVTVPRQSGQPKFEHKTVVNIDTGRLLAASARGGIHTYPFPIYEFDPENGTLSTWATGGTNSGWVSYCLPQNHRTGHIEGPYGFHIRQQKPGTSPCTTIKNLYGTLPCGILGGAKFDLQTAATPRQVAASYAYLSVRGEGWHFYLDASTWKPTATRFLNTKCFYNFDLDFYRGRHTQTMNTKVYRKWDIRFSAPKYSSKAYVAAAGLSGVRPGIPLSDGRRINLNPDAFVYLTLSNLIPHVFRAGGMLDAHGEATGTLDLSGVPKLGTPLWIVWMILDPNAPGGIAYIPDTYVMRV